MTTHPQLFSNIATFISKKDFDFMSESIAAIERVISSTAYQSRALSNAHPNALRRSSNEGVFMGYDFHLNKDRPKLIEINTNAGGAFLNTLLVSAQIACCPPTTTLPINGKEKLFREFVDMFLNEWRLQRGNRKLERIAIVDVEPEKQFLFPEFQIAQQIFIQSGIDALITDPKHLTYAKHQLSCDGKPIDLVYNRLTDFAFAEPGNQVLNKAYQADHVVVTPNPYNYALYADKRNLITLTDEKVLQQLGVNENDRKIITDSVPITLLVSPDNSADLWQGRKDLFFKPVAGYGGKATYRGDKLTKRVWQDILDGQYIAQQQVTPGARGIMLDNEPSSLKMDVRAYTYQGNIQLMAARLYQGQTTNFRTPGGGFSTVFVV